MNIFRTLIFRLVSLPLVLSCSIWRWRAKSRRRQGAQLSEGLPFGVAYEDGATHLTQPFHGAIQRSSQSSLQKYPRDPIIMQGWTR